jgi:hypothetical protein
MEAIRNQMKALETAGEGDSKLNLSLRAELGEVPKFCRFSSLVLSPHFHVCSQIKKIDPAKADKSARGYENAFDKKK